VTWCDFVVASERATFGFPEVKLGVPTIVGALRLPQRLGWQPAMELLLTGETISAERAREIGLALQVVEHDDVLPAAQRLAERLLAGAPLAQRAIKEVARRGPEMSQTDAIRFGETMRRVAGATEDAKEGAAAAREKRTPRWQGR
jgi:enoyl-CoA hydratase/carnithine racemase